MNHVVDKTVDHLKENNIILKPGDEKEYCPKNDMRFLVHDSGAFIIGSQTKIRDSRESSVNFHFKNGSMFDRKGFEGEHHLLEHLFFNRDFKDTARKNDVTINGLTSNERVWIINDGTFNLKDTSYGLEPVINKSFETIKNPFGLNEKKLKTEKSVITHEISELEADHNHNVSQILKEKLLGEKNIYSIFPSGKVESIEKVTLESLHDLLDKNFGTLNMGISIKCEGNGKELDYLVDKMVEFLDGFDRRGKKLEVDYSKFVETTKLDSAEPHKVDTGLKNNLTTQVISAILDVESYSLESLSLNKIVPTISDKFWGIVRDKGLGYNANAYALSMFPTKIMFLFEVTCSTKQGDITDELSSLADSLLNEVIHDAEILKEIEVQEKYRNKLVPVEQRWRLNFATEMYLRLGYFGNIDAARKRRISADSLESVLTKLLKIPKHSFIIGDLG